MAQILYFLIGGAMISVIGVIACLNIHNYRKSKENHLKIQLIKQKNLNLFHEIIRQQESLRKKYNDYIYITVSSKTAYIISRILLLEDPYEINRHMDYLLKMLIETDYRLQADYFNVQYIIAPLNNTIHEIEKAITSK